MRRSLLSVSLIVTISFAVLSAEPPAQKTTQQKTTPQCAASLADCPDRGCSKQSNNFDGNLNERKNITSLDGPPKVETITAMQKLDDPDNFAQGDDRTELKDSGEGKKYRSRSLFTRRKV